MRQLKEKEFNEQLRKQNKEYDEWENSLEGVLYNLTVFTGWTTTEERHKVLVAETLLKLPKKVRTKVLNEVIFLIMSDTAGMVVNARFSKVCKEKDVMKTGDRFALAIDQPIIMLNFEQLGKTKRCRMSAVAHEVAHFILKHHKMGKTSNPSNERKADDLTEKWGFKRAYKSKQYEIFERR